VRVRNLFVAGQPESSNIPELGEVAFHLFFVEPVRYPTEENHTSIFCLSEPEFSPRENNRVERE